MSCIVNNIFLLKICISHKYMLHIILHTAKYCQVWDDDRFNDDDLIDRIVLDVPNHPSTAISQTVSGVFNRVSLVLSYILLCRVNYYGSDCSVLCIPYNDDTNGHYTCNSTTGARICRDGWQNVDNYCKDG